MLKYDVLIVHDNIFIIQCIPANDSLTFYLCHCVYLPGHDLYFCFFHFHPIRFQTYHIAGQHTNRGKEKMAQQALMILSNYFIYLQCRCHLIHTGREQGIPFASTGKCMCHKISVFRSHLVLCYTSLKRYKYWLFLHTLTSNNSVLCEFKYVHFTQNY